MGEVKTIRDIHQQHKWWSLHVAHNSLEQTNSLVFFSLHWEKWIWLRKGFFTRWSGLIWAVVRDQNYQKTIRNTLACLGTTDQWTKDWDVGVTIFLLSLLSHTDSFWHSPPSPWSLCQSRNYQVKMPAATGRNLYPAEENENSVMDKVWSQVFPSIFLESTRG